ncbi:MAG: hypothetical protein HQL86_08805 [Magnetococcales bacterium]|nr:hypothetical protein [Magnetococcales bacterium]
MLCELTLKAGRGEPHPSAIRVVQVPPQLVEGLAQLLNLEPPGPLTARCAAGIRGQIMALAAGVTGFDDMIEAVTDVTTGLTAPAIVCADEEG